MMAVFYQPKKSVIHEKFDDETVIVNLETGCYYSLQGTGDAVWAHAAAGLSQAEIVARFSASFDAPAGEIGETISEFLEKLVGEQLLEAADAASGGVTPALVGGAFVPPSLQKYTDMEELLQLDPIHEVDELGWPSAKPPVG
jgi:hypothetical protein